MNMKKNISVFIRKVCSTKYRKVMWVMFVYSRMVSIVIWCSYVSLTTRISIHHTNLTGSVVVMRSALPTLIQK